MDNCIMGKMPYNIVFLWPLRLVWLLVCCLYTKVYLQNCKCMSFWLHGCCGEWEGGPVNQVYHTSWVAVVTPTDRPKSVRNCCLIELLCGVVCVVTLPFWHFCWCRGFCHRTWSDLLLFVFVEASFIGWKRVQLLLRYRSYSFRTRRWHNPNYFDKASVVIKISIFFIYAVFICLEYGCRFCSKWEG